MSELSGNLGEWSELVALLQVLIDKEVLGSSPIDGQTDFRFNVEYAGRTVGNERVLVEHSSESTVRNALTGAELPLVDLVYARDQIRLRMDSYRRHHEPNEKLTVPAAEPFVSFMGMTSLTAKSSQKADLELGIRDSISDSTVDARFSVKSLVGSSPTLLNASGATNFAFRVVGLDQIDVAHIGQIMGLRSMLTEILALGGSLEFESMANETFASNLRYIDTRMPEFIARALVRHYCHGESGFEQISKCLAEEDRINSDCPLSEDQYRFKFASLLEAVALGMVPATAWHGEFEVSGGVLLVEKDFNVRVIRARTHDEFRSGLLASTRLDTASRSKHKFGTLDDHRGNPTIDLNLQIRF
jgi:type II restriction enzyme